MEDEILKLKARNLGGAVGRALVVTSPESGLGNRHVWMSLDGVGPDVLERMARKYNFSVEVFKDPDDRNPTLIGNHDSLLRVRVENQGDAFIAHVPIKGDLRERLDSSDTFWLKHFPSRGDPCNSKTRGISDSLGRVNFKGQLDAAQQLLLASCGPYDSNARLRFPTDCRQLLAMSTGSGKTYTIWSIACKYLYAFAHPFDIFIVCQASTRHEIIKQSWDFPREGALRKLGLEIDMLLHGWERAIEKNGTAYTNLEYDQARQLLQQFKEFSSAHRLYNEDAEHKRGGLEAITKRRHPQHPQRPQRPDRPQGGGSADSLRCPKISNQKKPDKNGDGETLMLKEKKKYTELYFRFRRIRFVTYKQFMNGIYGDGPYKDFLECARKDNNGKLQMVPDLDPVSDWEHVLQDPILNARPVNGMKHPWPTKLTVALLDEAHAIVAPTIDRSLPANQRKRIQMVREVLTTNPFAFAGMYFFTATPLVRSPADVSSFGCLLQSVRYFMKNNIKIETALKWSKPNLKDATEWFRPVQQEASARFKELQTSLKKQRCPSESKDSEDSEDSEDSKNDSSILYELHDPRKLQALLLGHVFFYDAGGMARYFQPTIGKVYDEKFGKGMVIAIDHKKGIVKFQDNTAGTLDVPLSSFLDCDKIQKPSSFESRLNIANPPYLDDTERGSAAPPSPADALLDTDSDNDAPRDDSDKPAAPLARRRWKRDAIKMPTVNPETAPSPDKNFTHDPERDPPAPQSDDEHGMARHSRPTIGGVYNGTVLEIDHSPLEAADADRIQNPPSSESRQSQKIASPPHPDLEQAPLEADDADRIQNPPSSESRQSQKIASPPHPDLEQAPLEADDADRIQNPPSSESRQRDTPEPAASSHIKESHHEEHSHVVIPSDSDGNKQEHISIPGDLNDEEIHCLMNDAKDPILVQTREGTESWMYMGVALALVVARGKYNEPDDTLLQEVQCYVVVMTTSISPIAGESPDDYSHYVAIKIRPNLVEVVDSLGGGYKKLAITLAKEIAKKKSWPMDAIQFKETPLNIPNHGTRCGLYAAAMARIWLGLSKTNDEAQPLVNNVVKEANALVEKLRTCRDNEEKKRKGLTNTTKDKISKEGVSNKEEKNENRRTKKRGSDKEEKNATKDESSKKGHLKAGDEIINERDLDDKEVEKLVNVREDGGIIFMKGTNNEIWGSRLMKKNEIQSWIYISSAKAELLTEKEKKEKNQFDKVHGFVANMKMSRMGGIQGHGYNHYVTLIISSGHLLLIDTMPRVSNKINKKAKRLAKVVSDTQNWPRLEPQNFLVITLGIDEDGARSGLYAAAMSRISLKLTPMKKSWPKEGKGIDQLVREEATRLEKKLAIIRADK